MELDPAFVYTVIIVSVLVWLLMRFFLGLEGFGNAIAVTLVGFVLLPNIASAGMAGFLVVTAIAGLAVQQVYRTSFADSVVVTLIVMFVGSRMLPFLG
ncbi:MAG: hypothetical protein V1708_04480 [Candidatus Micrarchaeota archaeon]